MSKPVAFLLAELGVTKSHSRPRLARLAPAAGPSEPGGRGEFDESIPTRRINCSISAVSTAI